ncbi:PREDICTED: centrosomal protein kizuna-like [Elephantulus edwardii]|uniref:centrosomal protein kizuna-like n=1 Tax=Elephantulus edwardii TaxID=28737 RepID=UPI0003F078E2|nr:PREDICTED: centrosomal protein kizuna-like [Elephantulus edwardii]
MPQGSSLAPRPHTAPGSSLAPRPRTSRLAAYTFPAAWGLFTRSAWWGRLLGQPCSGSQLRPRGLSSATVTTAACAGPPRRPRHWQFPTTTRDWAASSTGCGTGTLTGAGIESGMGVLWYPVPTPFPPVLRESSWAWRRYRRKSEDAECEKKRLDLERKLNEYSHSDTCRFKLKYVKLNKYLKEICDSEKKACARNQEYLKQCEHIQAHIGNFITNTEKLQELKTEYETQIKKIQLLSKGNLGIKDELKDEDKKVAIQEGINSGTVVSRRLYQPATIFMGYQMSAISHIEDFNIEQRSTQPTKKFSIPDPHTCQQTAQSAIVIDSCVVQTNSDTQCLNKSDKIDWKAPLQIGEEMPVTASVLSEQEKPHCLETGSNIRYGKSNLSESKKSAELHSSLLERLPPQNRTTDVKCDSCYRSEGSEEEILTQEHIEVKEETAGPPVSQLSVSEYCESENKCTQENHSAWEGFLDHHPYKDPKSQTSSRRMKEDVKVESSSSSSDLTVSVSEDDLIFKSPEPQLNLCDKVERENGIKAIELIHSRQEGDVQFTKKKNCIFEILNSPESRKESSSTNSPTRKSEQPPHSNLLQTQWGQHATTMKEDSSLKDEATALLKKALTEECEERSSIHSNESSCSLPSILNDNGGIKEAKLGLWLNSVHTGEQDISGYREESKEESMTRKIPITETDAYQLLKQSTLQDNTYYSDDRFQKATFSVPLSSGFNNGSSTLNTKTTNDTALEAYFSSGEVNPLTRHENKRKLITTLKSKAFWGESDDSNSEIEAALRPRNHDTSTEDFDDFYN